MGAAESSQQGSENSKSTKGDTSMTIDCTLVEEHLQEMSKLRSNLEAVISDNQSSKRNLAESEKNRQSLNDKLNLKTDELIKAFAQIGISEQKRNKAEETVLALRKENETLKKLNENLHLCMEDSKSTINELQEKNNQITQELQCSINKFTENNEMWNAKHGKMNGQYSKVQSELQRYKSNKNAVQLVELQQQLQKLTSHIDTTTKKFTKEMQTKKRPIDHKELEKITRIYEENVEVFARLNVTLEKKNFPVILKTYKDLCQKNDQKILDAMKCIHDINKETKSLNEIPKTEIPGIIQRVTTLTEKYAKEIEALKQKSFVGDFKQEEKLYTDLLPALEEIKMFANSVPNNLNTSTSDNSVLNVKTEYPSCSQDIPKFGTKNKNNSKKKNKSKNEDPEKSSPAGWNFNVFDSETKNYSVILYDFPENTLSGLEHDAIDLINIKYFLGKLDLGDIENIGVRRLPIANNENIRPVIVNLSNMAAVERILGCTEKLTEMGLQNVKIANFNGKI